MSKEKAIAILILKVMNIIGILDVLGPDYGETKALREEIEALDMAMKSLKGSTIENNSTVESEWIPITDRLPENNSTELENVLISTDEGDVQIGLYDDEEKTWSIYCDDGTAWPVTAVAWMPLPKPYREGTDEA